ncbi:MAG: hypothetical protein ABI831_06825 [Betaproteobacteria bacterium]
MKEIDISKSWGDLFRMTQWLTVAVILYFVTFGFDLQTTYPGVQAAIYNIANVTMRAWVGYVIARTALGRLDDDGINPPMMSIARAILMGAVILTSK